MKSPLNNVLRNYGDNILEHRKIIRVCVSNVEYLDNLVMTSLVRPVLKNNAFFLELLLKHNA